MALYVQLPLSCYLSQICASSAFGEDLCVKHLDITSLEIHLFRHGAPWARLGSYQGECLSFMPSAFFDDG